MTNNFIPFTRDQIQAIMEIRHTVKPRKQLVTSGGTKVYMMVFNYRIKGD